MFQQYYIASILCVVVGCLLKPLHVHEGQDVIYSIENLLAYQIGLHPTYTKHEEGKATHHTLVCDKHTLERVIVPKNRFLFNKCNQT